MVKRITIRDVAREAGVSIALVSFVMNRDRRTADGQRVYRVSEDTVARILEVARRLNYHPNSTASSLRSGRSRTVGVIVSDIANPFFADIVRRIENVAYQSGYTVLFASTDECADKLAQMSAVLVNKGVDGLIVAPCEGGEECVRALVELGMPLVLIDREVEGVEVSSVVLDNVKAGETAVRYLHAHGYRKIEMASYTKGVSSLRGREEGYRSAMTAFGLADNVKIHKTVYGDAVESVRNVVADAHARGVEAMIFPTNSLSTLALQAISRLGLRIPDDMAFLGFDDNEIFDILTPTVAHVEQSVEILGTKSFELLRERIEKTDAEPVRFMIEPMLVEGGSVADING